MSCWYASEANQASKVPSVCTSRDDPEAGDDEFFLSLVYGSFSCFNMQCIISDTCVYLQSGGKTNEGCLQKVPAHSE
jgi:hypothetical protein